MSLSAARIDLWYMDEPDCQVDIRSVIQGETSVLQWRDHFTIKLSRKFAGLQSFNSETRSERTSFQAQTSAGTYVIWSHPNKKFICTQHSAPISDTITGEGTEIQTWEHYTEWEAVPETAFTATGG